MIALIPDPSMSRQARGTFSGKLYATLDAARGHVHANQLAQQVALNPGPVAGRHVVVKHPALQIGVDGRVWKGQRLCKRPQVRLPATCSSLDTAQTSL